MNDVSDSWQHMRLLASNAEERKDWREAERHWCAAAWRAPHLGLEISFLESAKKCAKNAKRLEAKG